MKKIAMAITSLALAGLLAASAIAWDCPGYGAGNGPGYGVNRAMDYESRAAANPSGDEAVKKFMAETVRLRRGLAAKRAELDALMSAGKPNPERAAQVSGEIFDLNEQLQTKRAQAGVNGPTPYCQGSQGWSCRGQGGGRKCCWR